VKNKSKNETMTMGGAATYRITVQGAIDPSWTSRLAGMSISEKILDNDEVVTILVGRLPDQTALSSVLNTLYELHLPVVSADCLENG
jgi:hypothetical protein